MPKYTADDLKELGITKLKNIAKELGISGYSKYKSGDTKTVIKLILDAQKPAKKVSKKGSEKKESPRKPSKKEVKESPKKSPKKPSKKDEEEKEVVEFTKDKLVSLKVADLKLIAKEINLTGISKLKKDELIDAIIKAKKTKKRKSPVPAPRVSPKRKSPPPVRVSPKPSPKKEVDERKLEKSRAKFIKTLYVKLSEQASGDEIAELIENLRETDTQFGNIIGSFGLKKLKTAVENYEGEPVITDTLQYFLRIVMSDEKLKKNYLEIEENPLEVEPEVAAAVVAAIAEEVVVEPIPEVKVSPKVSPKRSKKELQGKTVKQLQQMLKDEGITSGVSGKKKDEIIEFLMADKCNPENKEFCSDDEACDIRNNICVKKSPAEVKRSGLVQIEVNGHKIIGNSKAIEQLKKKLDVEEEAPLPPPRLSPKRKTPPPVVVEEEPEQEPLPSPPRVSPKRKTPPRVSPKRKTPPRVSPKRKTPPVVVEEVKAPPRVSPKRKTPPVLVEEESEEEDIIDVIEAVERKSKKPEKVPQPKPRDLQQEDLDKVLDELQSPEEDEDVAKLTDVQRMVLKCLGLTD